MMRWIRWVGTIIVLLGLGMGIWWMAHRRPAQSGGIPLGQPGMTLWATSLVGRENGEKTWEVRARTLWLSKDGRIAVIKDIQEAMMQVDDEKVTLSAPWARLDRNLMKLTVRGGIKGTINDGEFSTDGVYLDLLQQKLFSIGAVKFKSVDFSVSARRLEADLKAETVTLKGEIYLIEGEKTLQGRELTYFLNDKTYQLIGETEVELEL